MTYIIDVETLHHKLVQDKENLVIIDVRFDLNDTEIGEATYRKEHIPEAHYLHIDRDLSGEVGEHGGSHPLPEIEKLTETLSRIGVTHDKTVVIYDKGNDMFAPRAWWLLHYLGHENAYVLDGGFKRWKAEDYPVTTVIPNKKETIFIPNVQVELTVDIEDVKEKVKSPNVHLLDSRAKERYLGKVEPLYQKAGHIPGAKNYFWADVLTDEGNWKTEKELLDHFDALPKDDEIIVSCGSGISACPNILALKKLGYENIKLYPGSFSDWISYDENPVETKEE